MENKKYIKLLHNVSQKDLSIVGGKAANLGELFKAGLPVPEGFVLLTDAYKRFVAENKIDVKIDKLLKEIDNNDFESIKNVSIKIKKIIDECKLPDDLLNEINDSYIKYTNLEVTVRSSAVSEDSSEASFAGQLDSFLNVNNNSQLYKKIKKCWSSLWNPRVLAYRLKQGTPNKDFKIAVIIQNLIKAEKSGILFTANPINNRRDQLLINSSWGLGEAIVNGDVVPDQLIVNKKTMSIIESKISIKDKMTTLNSNGKHLFDVPKEKQKQPTLMQDEVFELLSIAKQVEDHFVIPQDIEWVYSNNNFYIVQSRPITTLYSELEPKNNDDNLRIYINFLLMDKVMPEPLTPMGEEIWIKFLEKILPNKWIKSAGGRIFVDTTELSRFENWWDKLKDNPAAMDPLTIETLIEVFKKNKKILKKQRKPLFKLIPTILSILNPSLFKFILTSIPKTITGLIFSPDKVVKKAHEFGENQIKYLKQKSKKLKTHEEKIDFIVENAPAVYYYIPLKILYYVINSITYLEKAKKIVNKHLDDTTILNKVDKSLSNNITTEMGMELLKIAKRIDQSDQKLSVDHPEVKRFMNNYGHRAYLEVDPGVQRWKEKPEYIVNLISSYIENKSYNERLNKFYQDKKEAKETIKNITKRLKEKGVKRDAKKVEKLLTKYRKLFGVRELPKYIMVKGVNIFRNILNEIGEELVKEGRLDNKEDIFYINLEYIKSERKLQKIASQNRNDYQSELKRSSVPRVMTNTGETIFSPYFNSKDYEFKGIPVSPGIYEGKIKILNSPEEINRIERGDILVTKATNPSWTPLFLKIGGLVTEMGGPISHGSIVAREYGIPAIAGLNNATTRFEDNQLVRINGETGVVEKLN